MALYPTDYQRTNVFATSLLSFLAGCLLPLVWERHVTGILQDANHMLRCSGFAPSCYGSSFPNQCRRASLLKPEGS
jgi:hypothetical protein